MVLFLSIGENGGQGNAGKLVAVVGLFEEIGMVRGEEEEEWVRFYSRGGGHNFRRGGRREK